MHVTVTRSGDLELIATATGSRYRCGPLMTTMWIVLRQHNWCPDSAAGPLAQAWRADSGMVRRCLDACLTNLLAADLVDLRP